MRRLGLLLLGITVFAGCGRKAPVVDAIPVADPQAIADAPDVTAAPGDWPWWRGPTRDNHASGELPPIDFAADRHVVWRTNIPGRGHASPIVVGGQVIVATADESDSTQSLIALDRATGQTLWTTVVHQGKLPPGHSKNSHASPTPAFDGQRVHCVFAVDDAVWATAVDLDGTILWQKEVGPFASKHGYGASPVIYKSVVIVATDHQGEGYVAALDRATGDIRWRTVRQRGASYSTPVIAHVAGRDQLLLSGQGRVISYDPASGEEIWRYSGGADATANTIAWKDDLVFASGGFHQTGIWCIRADGAGDVTETNLAWENTSKVYVPSPLIAGDVLLATRDDGILLGYEATTGKKMWAKRMQADAAATASPTLVGDLAFQPTEAGQVFIVRPGKRFEHVATCEMGEGIYASPVIVDGRLYLRTLSEVFCIGPDA
ncbi:MAG: PQQ-binding-like beta-propeller repeat protein [Planctomycetales bacterium]|nr:PQQ-binding-like beta-propeller repeat protein [Planctomycetales bacterium]